ncbi:hypothetical protein Barb6_00902 [Bacteroidales bacterium Barb6]|nr:hypothetical protein Barb6_00902 [Bacteroidales bacterium Barb6]
MNQESFFAFPLDGACLPIIQSSVVAEPVDAGISRKFENNRGIGFRRIEIVAVLS